MPVEIREITIRAEVLDAPLHERLPAFDPEAFRREILEACERQMERNIRRLRER